MVFISGPESSSGIRYSGWSASRFQAAVVRPFEVASEGPSLRDFARLVLDLRGTVRSLSGSGELRPRLGGRLLRQTTSASSLSLSGSPTAATLTSAAEVNSISTSYGPFVSSFGGASTTTGELDGTYDGSLGDETLTFTVTAGGVVGTSPVLIQITDSQSSTVDSILFGPSYVAGTPMATAFGNTLALSAGSAINGTSFQATVSSTVGSAVDAAKSFDGSGNDKPNFEPGLGVSAGTLTINGVGISVLASDSIASVTAKITASAAGVTAAFDSPTESVVLTQKTGGASSTITLGSDDSGFFAAVKLDTATVVPGADDEVGALISTVSALSGISTGDFSVNGILLTLDVAVDSLQDVLDRINASGAGVTASYDASAKKVSIVSGEQGAALTLDNGTSGFFTALELPEVTAARTAPAQKGFARPSVLRSELGELASALRLIFSEEFDVSGSVQADFAFANLRTSVQSAFEDTLDDTDRDLLRSGLGIDFDFGDRTGGVLKLDEARLARAFSQSPSDLAAFLFDEKEQDGRNGLFAAIEGALDTISAGVAARLGDAGGLLVDRLA